MPTHSLHNAFNEYYFVTFTCYQWLPLFESSDIYDYLPSWAEEINKRGVSICGYVVMPNHIHLLVYVKPEICNRFSITNITHFKPVTSFRFPFHRSGATLSKQNFLVYCDLCLHHETYCIIQVKSRSKGLNHVIGEAKRFLAYEIVSRLRKKNESQLLDLLANGVQEKERNKGKRHQVFRLSFDAKLIIDTEGIHRTLDYIHHNPVSGKWKLVDDFVDYEYSSAGYYENDKQRYIKVCHFLDAPDSSEFPKDNSEG